MASYLFLALLVMLVREETAAEERSTEGKTAADLCRNH